MPIYEYECHGCRRHVSLLVLSRRTAEPPACPRCGSRELTRLLSRFSTPRSEDARLDRLADPSAYGDLDENDPMSVARAMKRMGDEMGEDLGDEVEAAMEGGLDDGDGGDLEDAGLGAGGGDGGDDDGL